MNQRLQKFSNWLKQNDYSFGFITSTPNVFYLSGFYTNPHERLLSLIIFPNKEPILVCPNMEVSLARQAGWEHEMIGYDDTDNPWDLIKSHLNLSKDEQKIAVEKSHITLERFEKLSSLSPSLTFVSADEKLNELRMIKDEDEIPVLREAAKLADFGVEVGMNAIKKGKTEMEILAEIEFELKKKGIRDMSFSTLVLSGKNSASPHGTPGNNQIKEGDFVLFDLGVILDGYCSDITRTCVFGSPNDKQEEIYEAVHNGQLAAVEMCKPGVEIGRVDQTARGIIAKKGYGDYFIHRIGHGLGIEVHEYPSMTSENKELLQEGMTFTIEPGIYVPEIGGVRIEDDLLITKNGVEVLTKFPKDLQKI